MPSKLTNAHGVIGKRSATEIRAARVALLMINFDDLMIKKSGGSGLTPQGRLLMGLLIHGSMTVKEALMYTPLSYRAFYIMITRLKDLSLVTVDATSSDRRIRRLTLGRKLNPVLKELTENLDAISVKSHA